MPEPMFGIEGIRLKPSSAARLGQVAKSLPILLILAMPLLAGCSGEPADSPEPSEQQAEPTSADAPGESEARKLEPAATTAKQDSPSETVDRGLARTDPDGRKWIGDIPYDVWFDDPLAVVTDESAVAGGAANQPAAEPGPEPSASASTSKTPATPIATPADRAWSELISIQVLDDEVKAARNTLNEYLQSVGRFNQNLDQIRVRAAVLAALGEVAAQHQEQTAWTGNARYVRDLGAKIEEQAQERGRTAFDAARLPFDQLLDLLGAGRPTGLAEPNPQAEFAERADRGSLMKRMDEAYKWLRQNKATEADFGNDPEDAVHEAAVLAALSAVIGTEGYTSADEPEYRKHVEELVAGSSQMTAAVQNGNFAQFSEALSRVDKKCNECHREYRFADEF